MNHLIFIPISAGAGILTAFLYILWLRKSVESLNTVPQRSPVVWTAFGAIFGFLGRILLCAACFIAVSYGGHLDRLIAAAAGFAVTHTALVIITRHSMIKVKAGGGHDGQPGQN